MKSTNKGNPYREMANTFMNMSAKQHQQIIFLAKVEETFPKPVITFKDMIVDYKQLYFASHLELLHDGILSDLEIEAETDILRKNELVPLPRPDAPVEGNTLPRIEGVKNQTIEKGKPFSPKEGITATDAEDGDITAKIKVIGSVNTSREGLYDLQYTVEDSQGGTNNASCTITVKDTTPVDPPTDPDGGSETDPCKDIIGLEDPFADQKVKELIKAHTEVYVKEDNGGKDEIKKGDMVLVIRDLETDIFVVTCKVVQIDA